MKNIIFTCIFTLLLVLGITAKAINDNESISELLLEEGYDENDLKIYNSYENIEKNIVFNKNELLDVYYDKKNTNTKKPVVIFIYGGSWVTGNKIKYTKFGILLEKSGYVGVIPNYTLFPQGTVEDMVDDVYHAIQWTYQNIEKYGGDPEQIILTAHSAGSHLAALTIVKASLHLTNNGSPLSSLPPLKKAVLMNGPYKLNEEVIFHSVGKSVGNFFKNLFNQKQKNNYNSKADPNQSKLLPQFLLKYYNDQNISPIEILKKIRNNSIENHFNVGKFIFVYTSDDESVPESSAKNLIKEIKRTSKDVQYEYIYLNGFQHATVIYGIRDSDPEIENLYLSLIKK